MMTKKRALEILSTIAHCAERAADHTGHDRALDDLKREIARGERQHRAFVRRLAGHGRADIGARMTVAQATDYFLAKTLMQGCTPYAEGAEVRGFLGAPIGALDGVREDFVRAAVLCSNDRFRADFLARLAGRFPGMSERGIWSQVAELEYPDLVPSRAPGAPKGGTS